MPSRVLYAVTFGFISGILIGFNTYLGFIVGVFLVSGLTYFGFLKETFFLRRTLVYVLFIFILAGIFGYTRWQVAQVTPPKELQSKIGEVISVSAQISSDPVIGDGKISTILYVGNIGFRVTIQTQTVLAYGDTVSISGTLAKPENFQTNQGTEFDYISYLAKDNIFYIIPDARLLTVQKAKSFSLIRLLFEFRHRVEAILFEYLPKREAGFAAGILLGTKTSIPKDFYDDLVRTSTVHIIALSGYNVTIVAESISYVLSAVLPPVTASLTGGVGIILFVIMTGASSTALRAGLMSLLLIVARVTGRQADALRVLAFAGIVLIVIQPSYLTSDVSFQLSFLATIGLLVVSPTVNTWFENFLPYVLAEVIGTTLSAEISVAPFILYKMGVFSVVALPSNIVIVPFIPILMLLGFLVICVGFVVPSLGSVVGYPTYIVGRGIMNAISFSARIPFASVTLPGVSLTLILLVYIGVTWFFTLRLLTNMKE